MTVWRSRARRLLTWRRLRAWALVLVALYVVAWVDVVATGEPPLNSGGVPIAGDFIAFQAAGRLVLSDQAALLYSHDAVVAVQDSLLGGRIPNFYDAYRNPPFFALVYAPFAGLPLLWAFAVWCVIGIGCLALALRLLLKETPWLQQRWRGVLVFVLAFPPVYFGFIDGENALLSLLLFALIYRSFIRRQDVAVGVFSALGLFKPQLFFVLPLVLLLTRRYRALGSYAVTALVLLAISVALVGVGGMQAWLRILLEPEGGNATVNGWRMTSAKSFWDALLPGSAPLSLALYVLTALALVAALIRVWTRRCVDLPTAWLFTCLVGVLVDPHLVDYDLTVLVAGAIIAAPLVPRLVWVVLPLYAVSLLRAGVPLTSTVSLQLTPVLLILAVVATARAAAREQAIPPEATVEERLPAFSQGH
jgi:alpha-1,2-mannosyltransferase